MRSNEEQADREVWRCWERGVAQVTGTFRALSPSALAVLKGHTRELKELRLALQGIVDQVNAQAHCASCQGACCASGRYHFSAIDLLAYLVDRRTLFTPRFSSGLCPFLGEGGCLIPVAYRPFNCITFNCERIEDELPPQEVSRFYALEKRLRLLYGEIGELFPEAFMARALLNLDPTGAAGPDIP